MYSISVHFRITAFDLTLETNMKTLKLAVQPPASPTPPPLSCLR